MIRINEEFEQEYFIDNVSSLPLFKEREKMSILQLAELLLSCPKNSPAYVVLEHEFNLNIAKRKDKQELNNNMLNAATTIIAVILAVILGYCIGASHI